MKSIIVKNAQKMDLINYILDSFPSLKTSSLYKALRNKDIKINGERVSKNKTLNLNDKLDIYISDNILFNLPNKIDIVYEDDNILVAYKPQGILSNNEEKKKDDEFSEPTFEDLVKKDFPFSTLCHRLDRNTAGLLIFSKNKTSYDELYNAFKNGSITKKYIAYVDNSSFKNDKETLEKYILKDKKTGYSKIFDLNVKNSQKIITSYFVIYKNIPLNYSVLEVFIKTGKTHQIRAQLKAINHPVIGDLKYGKNEVNKKFKVYKQLLFAVHYSFNFDSNSKLYYLNDLSIDLNQDYYNNKLGSDIFGKTKK